MRSLGTLFLVSAAARAGAAQPARSANSEIVATGSGQVTLPPDRALVRIAIATRAATAGAASLPNGPLVARVRDTLAALVSSASEGAVLKVPGL